MEMLDCRAGFRFLIAFSVLGLILPCAEAELHIVFRYDDLSADRPGDREVDAIRSDLWDAEREVDGLFEKYGFSYVVAVIPRANSVYDGFGTDEDYVKFADDEEKVAFVSRGIQRGRVEVAQHGYKHVNHVWEKNRKHRHGEFRERDYQSQLSDIQEGWKILTKECGFESVKTFVPPWHGWDANTARALKKVGLNILSSRRFSYYNEVAGLTVIPCTATLEDMETQLAAGEIPEDGIIVVIYHPSDIAAMGREEGGFFGLERFGGILDQISIMHQIEVVTFQQLAEFDKNLSNGRFRWAVRLEYFRDFWATLVPRRLCGKNQVPTRWLPGSRGRFFYLGQDEYKRKVVWWGAITSVFLAVLVLLGAFFKFLLVKVVSTRWQVAVNCLLIGFITLGVLGEMHMLYKGYHMVAARAVPIFFGLGVLVVRVSKQKQS